MIDDNAQGPSGLDLRVQAVHKGAGETMSEGRFRILKDGNEGDICFGSWTITGEHEDVIGLMVDGVFQLFWQSEIEPVDTPLAIAEALIALRKAAKVSQRMASTRARISDRVIREVEQGKRRPTPQWVTRYIKEGLKLDPAKINSRVISDYID